MKRRDFLAAAAASAAAAAPPKPPNILLILTDQQTHDAWSGARNPWLRTPAMDSLAARGVAFSETYCTYPVCSPSRSSIFTGRMPHETGVMDNGVAIRAGIPTMGEVFCAGGYETVYGGKWHLPKSFTGAVGFQQLIGGHALGARMDRPLADACTKWLRGRSSQQPFLLVASFMNPHDICDWIRQHPGSRNHADVRSFPPAPANMAVDPNEPEAVQHHRFEKIDLMSQAVAIASEWQRDDVRHYLHDYYRMVEQVDAEIGRVLEAVDWSNTIVAFCSDHGEGMGAHRWVQKAAFYEESVRVPMIFAGPGIKGGHVHRGLASLADLMPTLCDLAGLSSPADMRGVSLRPALEGKPLETPFVVSELRYGDVAREGRMIRTPRYKYIVFNSGKRPEQFFDLQLDPGETTNLLSHNAIAEHRALLRSWLDRTGDDFRPNLP